MSTFWISFADDTGCLGVAIVDTTGGETPMETANRLGLNPGGEAAFFCTDGMEGAEEEIAELGKNRLISADELKARDYRKISELPTDVREKIKHDTRVTIICEDCNE